MDLVGSVHRLDSAFRNKDVHSRGTIDRADFRAILQLHGGHEPQIKLLEEQFAVSAYPQFVDYGSFMAHLEGVLGDATPSRERGETPPKPMASRDVNVSAAKAPPMAAVSVRPPTDAVIDVALRSAKRSLSREPTPEPVRREEQHHETRRTQQQPPRFEAAVQRCSLRDVFALVDTDQDGRVSAADAAIVFAAHSVPATQIELESLIESLGLDPEASVGHEGFCVVVSRLRPSVIEMLRRASTWGSALVSCNAPANGATMIPGAASDDTSGERTPPATVEYKEPKPATSHVVDLHPAFHTQRGAVTGRSAPAAAPSAKNPDAAVSSTGSRRPSFMRSTASTSARWDRRPPAAEVPVSARSNDSARASRSSSKQSKPSRTATPTQRAATPQTEVKRPTVATVSLKPRATKPSGPSQLESLANQSTPKPRLPSDMDEDAATPRSEEIDGLLRDLSVHLGPFIGICSQLDATKSGLLLEKQVAAALTAVVPRLTSSQADAMISECCSSEGCAYHNLAAQAIAASSSAAAIAAAPALAAQVSHSMPAPPKANASATLRQLLREELVSVCDGDVKLLVEHFATSDPEGSGFVAKAAFVRALRGIYSTMGATMPTWVGQRATKLARLPFEAPETVPVDVRHEAAARKSSRGDDAAWCCYKHLLHALQL